MKSAGCFETNKATQRAKRPAQCSVRQLKLLVLVLLYRVLLFLWFPKGKNADNNDDNLQNIFRLFPHLDLLTNNLIYSTSAIVESDKIEHQYLVIEICLSLLSMY